MPAVFPRPKPVISNGYEGRSRTNEKPGAGDFRRFAFLRLSLFQTYERLLMAGSYAEHNALRAKQVDTTAKRKQSGLWRGAIRPGTRSFSFVRQPKPSRGPGRANRHSPDDVRGFNIGPSSRRRPGGGHLSVTFKASHRRPRAHVA